jgi:hypothetical protein
MRNKFYFRMPSRAEWRKFHFKKQDGVLQSLEYLVHSTIMDPALLDYQRLEEMNIKLTEQIGQRLADMIMSLDDTAQVETLEVDITKPFVAKNVKPTMEADFVDIIESYLEGFILRVLEKHKEAKKAI